MNEISRELIAYAIITTALLISVPWVTIVMRRHRRDALRRRGIKRFGH